jgi:hypothetical protein
VQSINYDNYNYNNSFLRTSSFRIPKRKHNARPHALLLPGSSPRGPKHQRKEDFIPSQKRRTTPLLRLGAPHNLQARPTQSQTPKPRRTPEFRSHGGRLRLGRDQRPATGPQMELELDRKRQQEDPRPSELFGNDSQRRQER